MAEWWESAPPTEEENWWEAAPPAERSLSGMPPPAPKPLSPWEKIQQAATGGLYQAGQALKGAVQEAPLVAMRAANMPRDIVSGAISKGIDVTGSPELMQADIERARREYELRKKFESPFAQTEDTTIGEKVGRGLSRAAPQLALAGLTGGGSLPAQMTLGGGTQGMQSLSEGASPGDAAFSAGLAAAAPGAGRLLSGAGRRLGKAAIEQYSKALAAQRIPMKATSAKIVPELLERGVTGDLESLAARGAKESAQLGKALEQQYAAAGQAGRTLNAGTIADELEALKAPFIVQGTAAGTGNAQAVQQAIQSGNPSAIQAALAGQGAPVIANPGAVTAIENIQSTLRELGDAVAPDQLWKFRQNVDDIVRATNGFTREIPRGKAAAIAKQARAVIQKELTAAVPDVARLNSEYALWQGLEDVAKATIQRQVGQQGSRGWLARTAGGAVGGTVGAITGGGPVGAAGGALVGQEITNRLAAAVSSPTWRTVSAVQKRRLAQLLTSGQPEAAMNYLARLGASASSQPEVYP